MTKPVPPISVDLAAEVAGQTPGIRNTEPGFANTYGQNASAPGGMLAASLPAFGVGGLGALLLYHRYLQDKRQAQQKEEKEKQASLDAITAQLPGLHPKDMLLGAALGGTAGLAYDALASNPKGEKRLPKALRRILSGAALGATGANIVGDRARRYITNTQLPFGYGASGSVLPKSFRQFWEGAVLDKPSFDPAGVKALEQNQPQNKGYPAVLQNIIGARRELWRRAFGVHSNNNAADFWQKNKGSGGPDYYSLNETRKDYPELVKQLFLPTDLFDGEYAKPVFINPGKTIPQENAGRGWLGSDMFGSNSLLGGQQVALLPTAGGGYRGRVLDRQDVTPTKEDMAEFKDAILSGKIFNAKWRDQQRTGTGYSSNRPNSAFMKSMLGRLLIDKVLTEEHPWVSQSFNMPIAPAATFSDTAGRIKKPEQTPKYDLQFTRESGKPATEHMGYADLLEYLLAMRKGKATPKVNN